MNRREILKYSTVGLSAFSLPSLALKNENNSTLGHHRKVIWIILRGGMDGLHATVPTFEQSLMTTRKAIMTPIKGQLLPLKNGFALHPELKFMHKLFKNKQLNTVIATSTPYRERSHFEGQDFLESGLPSIDLDNGWLARALKELNLKQHKNDDKQHALAVSRSIPIAMRGNENIMSWYPSNLPPSSDDLHQRLIELYKRDKLLSMRLEQALETKELVDTAMGKKIQLGQFTNLTKSCAKLMSEPNGPAVAMLEIGGWDTHNNQVNRLNKRFKELDQGIKLLHNGMKKHWGNTLFIVSTEFGRTVKMNGTGGTDHGTATSMFIGGGALKNTTSGGGKVLGQWPGLSKEQLYENRDLRPTSNSFDWMADALADHWDLSNKQISRIFPKS